MESRPNKQTAARRAMPFASAAFQLSKDSDLVADWEEKLQIMAEVVKNPEFDKILRDPKITPPKLRKVIKAVTDKLEMNDEQAEFIGILVDERKLSLMPWIYDGFLKAKKQDSGLTDVLIITAKEITEEQVNNITTALNKKFNIKAAPTTKIDPELLGGVKIVINDNHVIDQSIKGQLERMKRHLNKPPAP